MPKASQSQSSPRMFTALYEEKPDELLPFHYWNKINPSSSKCHSTDIRLDWKRFCTGMLLVITKRKQKQLPLSSSNALLPVHILDKINKIKWRRHFGTFFSYRTQNRPGVFFLRWAISQNGTIFTYFLCNCRWLGINGRKLICHEEEDPSFCVDWEWKQWPSMSHNPRLSFLSWGWSHWIYAAAQRVHLGTREP